PYRSRHVLSPSARVLRLLSLEKAARNEPGLRIKLESVTINFVPKRPIPSPTQRFETLPRGAPGYAPRSMLVRLCLILAMFVLAGGLAARRATFLYRLVRLGRPVSRRSDLGTRLGREGVEVLGQRKLFQRFVPGLM